LKTLGIKIVNGRLHLPLRVTWVKDKPLNLVPIDYVVEVMFKIFKDKASFNKTFHIVNPAPPTVEDVLEYTCDALNVSIFKLVGAEEFLKRPKTPLERVLLKNVQEYSPYLEIPEPLFNSENTFQIVGNRIKAPDIDSDFVFKLVNYCIQNNWGKKILSNKGEKKEKNVSV